MSYDQLFALADCQGESVGECDRCHVDGLDLYNLDDNDPAGWQWCRACVRRYARKLKQIGYPATLKPEAVQS